MRALARLLVALMLGCQSEPAPTVRAPRLVILGFDGVDPRRVDGLVHAGKLKAVARLSERGHRGELVSTNPPQSPVAWAAFATGLPPGENGIFDFVDRDAQTYLPTIATTRVRHAKVEDDTVIPAEAVSLRRGEAFWDILARAGISTTTLSIPYAYPPPPDGARSLAGLGAPDVRGTNSTFTLLVSDRKRTQGTPPAGGQIALLTPLADGGWRAMLEGPRIQVKGESRTTQVPVLVATRDNQLEVTLGGAKQTLGPGQTGDYVRVEFAPSPRLAIHAATRVTVRQVSPPEAYVEPLSLVPEAPYLPVSSPADLAAGLWRRFGAFKTVGWVDDTSGLGAAAMDEDQFLAEARAHMRFTADALTATLREEDHRLVIAVFTSTDRIAHMFYRYTDPEHPAAPKDGDRYAAAIDQSYVAMDGIIEETEKLLMPGDALLVMSDHGFASFRRGLNLNSWLVREGFLTLGRGVREPRDFFRDVDWARSKAYALGTGAIYVNLDGREAQGSVSAGQAPQVVRAIEQGLASLRDGKARVVAATYRGDQIFAGAERRRAPELRVAVGQGYRVSWATSLGGMPRALFEDNDKKWSGDHASSRPEDVPGFLVANRRIRAAAPRIEDIAATTFAFFGVPPPAGLSGRPLFE